MVDTSTQIIQKYRQNISGLFRRFRIMIAEAPREIVSEFLIDKIEEFTLSRDDDETLTRIYKNVVEKDCISYLLKKDVQFFEDHCDVFLGDNVGFLDIARGIFAAKNDDGSMIYSTDNVSKLFDFAIAIVKLSVKYVLSESKVVSVVYDDTGDISYTTSRVIVPGGSAETLSSLVNTLQIKGVPVP